MSRLDSIPKSHRRFFVKKVTQLPSGDRNDPHPLKEAWYYVMDRPVDTHGNKSSFMGTKITKAHGPFVGDKGKEKAEELARIRNESWHG